MLDEKIISFEIQLTTLEEEEIRRNIFERFPMFDCKKMYPGIPGLYQINNGKILYLGNFPKDCSVKNVN